jgi:pimeloyl-ACP methyl ester carboxylesterase
MKRKAPIVMIHGAFCGAWAFEKFRRPFEAEGFRVTAPTLRHHDGREPPGALGRTSLSDYADDLLAVIAKLGEPPILIGHSLGGLLAQILATRTAVVAAVLISPSPPWGTAPTTLHEIMSAQALLLNGDYWQRILRPSYVIAAEHSLDRLSRDERTQVYTRFVPESGRATFEVMHWMLDFARGSYVSARSVTCPLLCLTGSDDRISPVSTSKQIARRYEGRAVFEELSGHSHWPIGEPGWQNVAERIIVWLERTMAKTAFSKAKLPGKERGVFVRSRQ